MTTTGTTTWAATSPSVIDTALQNGDIKRAMEQMSARRRNYSKYADYYDGEQRLNFASAKYRSAYGAVFRDLALNVCAPVIEALTDRLQIKGFGVDNAEPDADDYTGVDYGDPEDAPSEKLAKAMETIWDDNRMAQGSGEVHQEATIEGDAYLIVWPDENGQPVFYPNEAALMTVRYDQEKRGVLKWAAKAWVDDDGTVRLNMYYPDRIEKYKANNTGTNTMTNSQTGALSYQEAPGTGYGAAVGLINGNRVSDPNSDQSPVALSSAGVYGTFAPFQVDGEEWPLPNKYGKVPVFHFANNSRIGQFGRSELKSVVPMQDAINKCISDMLVGMETQALPQRWATGIELPTDEAGRPVNNWTSEPGSVWVANGSGLGAPPAFGQFNAADIERFLKAKDSFKQDVAVITGTPLHYMQLNTGNPPSGEALKTAEDRHVKKITDRELVFGSVWSDAMAFALLIAGYGDVDVETQWENPATVSRLELLNELILTQEIANPVLLEKAGFTDDEIGKLMAGQDQVNQAAASAFTNGPGKGMMPGAAKGADVTAGDEEGDKAPPPPMADNGGKVVRPKIVTASHAETDMHM